MDQIIFHTNLKYIIAGLTREQKGLLLEMLLDCATGAAGGAADMGAGAVTGASLSAVDETVANISRYIMLLQQDMAAKRQRMRDIGAKGGAARRRNVNGRGNAGSSGDDGAADDMPDLFATAENATVANTAEDVAEKAAVSGNGTAAAGGAFSAAGGGSGHQNNVQPLLQHCCGKRKEAKENNILNNKNNLFSERKISLPVFQRPSAAEVQAFVSAEGLKVDAATFVDFYDSHGWCVGRTAIKNWKATVRLWHRRACSEAAETGLAAGYAAGSPAGGYRAGGFTGGADTGYGAAKNGFRAAKDAAAVDDEGYWSELEERVLRDADGADGTGSVNGTGNESGCGGNGGGSGEAPGSVSGEEPGGVSGEEPGGGGEMRD
ncbi:MAG: hypothetical protein BHW56_03150 [Acetobacter sp. 46_36]|nr:MAG: hypothetical protein BHW56_03150 [Acetobacter sp. 46_36]